MALLAALLTACTGGDIQYERDTSGGSADTAQAVPLPAVVTAPVAPDGYKTTPEQAAQWKQKLKSGDDFNDLLVRHSVVVAAPAVTAQVKIEPDRLRVPVAGNEALLALTPGAPFIGAPATAAQRASGQSNNVLGFLRKVKSVSQVDGEIVIETQPAHIEDVMVGAASLSFPKEVTEINIGDEVDLYKIIPDLPAPLTGTTLLPKAHKRRDSSGAVGTKKGALSQDLSENLGYGFDYEFDLDLLDLDEPIELGPVDLTVEGTGQVHAIAELFVGAFLKLSIEETWLDPIPHVTYFFAGAGGKADLGVDIDVNAKISITASTDGGDKDKEGEEAKKDLSSKPIEKRSGHKASKPGEKGEGDKKEEFSIGKPKYYQGPEILGIPTVLVLTVEAKCDFTIYGEIDATASAELSYDAVYGIEYNDGNWGVHQPAGFQKKFGWDLRNVGGGAEVDCEIGPRVDWLFADIGGPFIEAKAGLKGSGVYTSICPDPGKIVKPQQAQGKIDAEVDIGVTATVGVGINLFVWSTEWSTDLLDTWWTLWSDSWGIPYGFGTCPTDCFNGQQDDYETGVDCGGQAVGGACPGCKFGGVCEANPDCGVGFLCQGGACGNLNCQTGKQEAYETDVNCGGLCGTAGFGCASGKKCVVNGDCDSQNCDPFTKLCGIQQCNNGVRDWWETDVDCGGNYCPACTAGQTCTNQKDCSAGNTCVGNGQFGDTSFGICQPPNCDLVPYFSGAWAQKGDMTDVMCGGMCAHGLANLNKTACSYGKDDLLSDKKCGIDVLKCDVGKKCLSGGDCGTDHCYNGVCTEIKCNDGLKEDYEADTDCGGWCSVKCPINKACTADSDCQSNVCNDATVGSGKVCALCRKNGVLDGFETDVDCGSQCSSSQSQMPGCKVGQKCQIALDCATGYTTQVNGQDLFVDAAVCTNGKCALPCYNKQWDPASEADVDCGGQCAAKCPEKSKCASGNDCMSGGCFGGNCAPVCQNGKQDAGEAAIDCGGTCTTKCLKGMTCLADGDCTTGQCIQGVCGVDPCKDGVLSPGEGDVDCGGGCAKKCITGGGCKADKDCGSGFCDGAHCTATSCTDKKQDAGESDLDCGGPCAGTAACGIGGKCKLGGDCGSGICSSLGKCVASTCVDGVKSGNETDQDCGGSCSAKCTTDKGCKSGADCDSAYCNGTVCVGDYCSDKVLSPGEADVDCGGTCSKKCSSGAKCNGGGDCLSGACATNGTCAANTCEDGKKSSGEADIDCGGSCATPCLTGKTCNGGIDCASGLCAAISLACVATTCQDEITDSTETDVDCGGGCKKCALNKGCASNADCQTGFCDGSKCVATFCTDKQFDGDETATDCGGTCGNTCVPGQGCGGDKDCASGFCDSAGKTCLTDACLDHHKDAGEADSDCGGPCAVKCVTGKACGTGGDCQSGVCAASGVCVATTCDDGKLTPGEADIDCGGSCPQKCTSGQACGGGTDCDSGFCSAALKCVGGACEDGKLSAGETDIDCGGVCTAVCALGQGCKAEKDCLTGFCDGTACVASACVDRKQDLGETGKDCGGPCAVKCDVGTGCATGGDCASGICTANSTLCVASTCVDQRQDGDESDSDCGGSCGAKCPSGALCGQNSDCSSGYCDGVHCVSDPCVDNQTDAGESDKDCGNVCAAKCSVGQGCGLPGDCSSTFCDGSQCVATACLDKKTDFSETDVDCGGPCGATCAVKQNCAGGGDCASGFCAATSLICVVDACGDEVQNGSETAIDCGGGSCAKCTVGKGCAVDGDCASGYCDGTVCVSDHCQDKQKDVGETDTDCGGTCGQACDNGAGCALATDCTSTFCAAIALACVATPCADQVQDFTETGVDCGGGICANACPTGQGCASASDCISGFCNTTSGKCVADHCGDGVMDGNELGPDCGGDCAGCQDGVACSHDTDCVSGTCNPAGSGLPAVCGCPPWTVATTVHTGGVYKTQCVRNFFSSYNTDSCPVSPESPYIIACNNSGLEFTLNAGILYSEASAKQYCDDMDIGGHDDWHLPTLAEMMTIIQGGSTVTMTGLTMPFYSNGLRGLWTASTIPKGFNFAMKGWNLPAGSPYFIPVDEYAWVSPVFGNTAPLLDQAGDSFYGFAFCARFPYGTPSLPNPRFVLVASGQVVQDRLTNRYWFRSKLTHQTQGTAAQYCASLYVPGMNGTWRLPTLAEQMSIVDTTKQQPFWDTDFFPAVDPPNSSNSNNSESFVTADHDNQDWLLPWPDGTYPSPYAVYPWDGRIYPGGGYCNAAGCGTSSAMCIIP